MQPPPAAVVAEAAGGAGQAPVGRGQHGRTLRRAAERERLTRADAPGLRLIHHDQQHRPGPSSQGHGRFTAPARQQAGAGELPGEVADVGVRHGRSGGRVPRYGGQGWMAAPLARSWGGLPISASAGPPARS